MGTCPGQAVKRSGIRCQSWALPSTALLCFPPPTNTTKSSNSFLPNRSLLQLYVKFILAQKGGTKSFVEDTTYQSPAVRSYHPIDMLF